jgi:Uncharacterized conserved protein (DUF2304).
MLKDVNINTIQWIAIAGSVIFIVFILELIRKKKIKEEFSLLWLFFGIVFLVLSVWRESLALIAFYLGFAYPPAALFLILIVAVISILVHFSILISRLTEQAKTLIQEVGLLKMKANKMPKDPLDSAGKQEKNESS